MITILIPTFEEKNNLKRAVDELNNVLKNYNFNILFVDDDSRDGSKEVLEKLKIKHSNVDFLIRKSDKKDLTESFKLGISIINSKYTCVIDCDLQHDIGKIPKMIEILMTDKFQIVLGSRFSNKDQNINVDMPKHRILLSKMGIFLSKLLRIGNINDPLSGFFAFKTEIVKKINQDIKTKGFKVLLTILFILRKEINVFEIEAKFKRRYYGNSKLNFNNKLLFIKQILYLLFF